MHFAIFPEERAVGIEYRASVVVDAGGAALKERDHQRDVVFLGHFGEQFGGRPRNRFGKIEKRSFFGAAEIFAAKQLIHADDLRATLSGFADFGGGAGQIVPGIPGRAHLDQANGKFIRHGNYRTTQHHEN